MQDVEHPNGRRAADAGAIRLVDPNLSCDHQVELQVIADPAWLSSVRLLAADVAARADFDVDAVADIRLAVDEACAELLRSALPGSVLTCRFALVRDRLTVTATVPVVESATFDNAGFGWRVLSILADEVEVLTGADAAGTPALGLRLDTLRRDGAAR